MTPNRMSHRILELGLLAALTSSCQQEGADVSAVNGKSSFKYSQDLTKTGFRIATYGELATGSGPWTPESYPISVFLGDGANESPLFQAHFLQQDPNASQGFALGYERYKDSIVFTWPPENKVIHPSNRKIELELKIGQFSRLVGTLLKREAVGFGEEEWARRGGVRSTSYDQVWEARRGGSTQDWCRAVAEAMVGTFVPEGSEFYQYGNCGEGGHVGACLAKRVGFPDNEIRLCSSANDHMFAMHKDPDGDAWCIMDRWDLIGHYRCGVDVDTELNVVTVNGVPTTREWFQRVACLTIDEYMKKDFPYIP